MLGCSKILKSFTKSSNESLIVIIIATSFSTLSQSKSLHKDSYYFTRLLQSNPNPSSLAHIHAQIITCNHSQNPFVTSNLISKYTEIGHIDIARGLFDRSPVRDVFLWNVMIKGYANAGPQTESISVYNEMRKAAVVPNCYTYPFVLKACGAVSDERMGKAVHSHAVVNGLASNVFVSNALVAFYAKSRDVEVSRRLFDEISVKDLVSWNSMIAGYAQNDHFHEAVGLFRRMLRDYSATPDHVTLVAVLPACAALAAAQEGIWIHAYAIKNGTGLDAGLACGIIGMYASSGRLETARVLFDKIRERNLMLCNSMIHAYGTHGRGLEALEIFYEMLEMGIEPDSVCFVCLLSACSHAGLIDKGFEIFEMMGRYRVDKRPIHYACIVDMLGRAGQLGRALEFIKEMPVEPDSDVWGALLGACRIWNDVALAEKAAKRLFILDPENAGRYALLANIYEDVGRVEDAARVRKAMRDRGVRKPQGSSMVEVDTEVHTFGVEDESHPFSGDIYDVLGLLKGEMEDQTIESAAG